MTTTFPTSGGAYSPFTAAAGLPLQIFKPVLSLGGLTAASVALTGRAVVYAMGIVDTRDTPASAPVQIPTWQQQQVFDPRNCAVVVVIRHRTDSHQPKVDLEEVTVTLGGLARQRPLADTGEFAGTDDPVFAAVLEELGVPVFGPLPIRGPAPRA